MEKIIFLEKLQEELELDDKLTLGTRFKDLEEWDSMAAMLLIGFVSNEFEVTLTGEDIETLDDINSLITKIGIEKFS